MSNDKSAMESSLQSLRDIEGVLGSFLLDDRGQLLARDMPGIFDNRSLVSASLRCFQLRAALEAASDTFDACTARFGEFLLLLRAAEARTLCVLCPIGTNLNALQMGINLVARRVAAARERSTPVPSRPAAEWAALPIPEPAPVPVPVSAPQDARPELVPYEQGPARFFRGRPVP